MIRAEASQDYIKADALYFLNDVEQFLENYLLTIGALEDHPLDTVYLIESYSHAGFCYESLGIYLEAIPYYKEALDVTIAANDSMEMANQLSHIGLLHANLSRYQKATEYLNQAYLINQSRQDTIALAYDLVNLGDLRSKMSDYESTIEYYKGGLKVKKARAGNHNTNVLRLGKLSEAYLTLPNIDSAQKYNAQAIDEALKLNDSLSFAKQLITQAKILNKEGKHENALNVGLEAYGYFFGSEGQYEVRSAFAVVDAYVGRSQLRKADDLLKNILRVIKDSNLVEDLLVAYKKRADLHELLGNPGSALVYYKEYQIVKDTILLRDKQQAILSLDKEYQTTQKEQQIALLEAKDQVSQLQLSERRNNIIALVALILGIVVMCIGIYFWIQKKHHLQNQVLTAEINQLRSQIKVAFDGQVDDVLLEHDQINSLLQKPLSAREFEVLRFALSDLSNSEIAEKVFVSVNTVKFHLKNNMTSWE